VLSLNEALNRLTAVEPRVAELVQLRYFVGLSIPEVAETLGISPRTADAWWAYARAWLLGWRRVAKDCELQRGFAWREGSWGDNLGSRLSSAAGHCVQTRFDRCSHEATLFPVFQTPMSTPGAPKCQ
jgi:hypothetical protein